MGEPGDLPGGVERARAALRVDAAAEHLVVARGLKVLCPFNVTSLPEEVVMDARHVHPEVIEDGRLRAGTGQAHVATFLAEASPRAALPGEEPLPLETLESLSALREDRHPVCAVSDGGRNLRERLLAARPVRAAERRNALRLAHELCDQLEIHSGGERTTVLLRTALQA